MGGSTFWLNLGGCLVLIGAAALAITLVCILARRHRRAEMDRARQAYEASLADLRKDPKNPELKEETLRLGRNYSRLTAGRDGVLAFDEAALTRQVQAICPPVVYPVAAEESVEERLEQLKRYRLKGLINDQEYQQKREEILRGSEL